MARNLRSRVERIARRIGPPVGKWVIVGTSSGDDPPIERTGPRGANLSLRVPYGPGDPMERLSDEQRAMIGPNDRVVVIRYVPGGLAHA